MGKRLKDPRKNVIHLIIKTKFHLVYNKLHTAINNHQLLYALDWCIYPNAMQRFQVCNYPNFSTLFSP